MSGSPRPLDLGASLIDVAAATGASASGDVWLSGITHDSTEVRGGDLFVAVPGLRRHGCEFAASAVQGGAVAIATDETGLAACADLGVPVLVWSDVRAQMAVAAATIYQHPERNLRIVGVTGTNGKTTVTHLVRQVGAACAIPVAVIGTIGTFLGDEQLAAVRTTPESPDLFATFALAVQRGIEVVAMEVSSHAIALERTASIPFAVAAFTNLSQDHLDFHGDMQTYFGVKKQLFRQAESAVVSLDTSWGRELAAELTLPKRTIGIGGDYSAHDIVSTALGETEFVLDLPRHHLQLSVHLPMVGEFNVINSLITTAIWELLGLPPQESVPALALTQGVPGRLERIVNSRGWLGIVDYAHTPEAVAAVLSELQQIGPVITVLGCGGDRDAAKRPLMGAAAAAHSAVVIVTDDNPRSEEPAAIRAAVLQGISGVHVHEVADRREAIALAARLANPGDVVAVLGKGHETGQEVAGTISPFDDRQVLREVSA